MSRYIVSSRCECQAYLSAELDEKRQPVAGWAMRGGARESAPAHSIHPELERFDIGWLCNFCGRNTLRTFYAGALRKKKEPPPPAAIPEPTPPPPPPPPPPRHPARHPGHVAPRLNVSRG
jgi:hypothetical protein